MAAYLLDHHSFASVPPTMMARLPRTVFEPYWRQWCSDVRIALLAQQIATIVTEHTKRANETDPVKAKGDSKGRGETRDGNRKQDQTVRNGASGEREGYVSEEMDGDTTLDLDTLGEDEDDDMSNDDDDVGQGGMTKEMEVERMTKMGEYIEKMREAAKKEKEKIGGEGRKVLKEKGKEDDLIRGLTSMLEKDSAKDKEKEIVPQGKWVPKHLRNKTLTESVNGGTNVESNKQPTEPFTADPSTTSSPLLGPTATTNSHPSDPQLSPHDQDIRSMPTSPSLSSSSSSASEIHSTLPSTAASSAVSSTNPTPIVSPISSSSSSLSTTSCTPILPINTITTTVITSSSSSSSSSTVVSTSSSSSSTPSVNVGLHKTTNPWIPKHRRSAVPSDQHQAHEATVLMSTTKGNVGMTTDVHVTNGTTTTPTTDVTSTTKTDNRDANLQDVEMKATDTNVEMKSNATVVVESNMSGENMSGTAITQTQTQTQAQAQRPRLDDKGLVDTERQRDIGSVTKGDNAQDRNNMERREDEAKKTEKNRDRRSDSSERQNTSRKGSGRGGNGGIYYSTSDDDVNSNEEMGHTTTRQPGHQHHRNKRQSNTHHQSHSHHPLPRHRSHRQSHRQRESGIMSGMASYSSSSTSNLKVPEPEFDRAVALSRLMPLELEQQVASHVAALSRGTIASNVNTNTVDNLPDVTRTGSDNSGGNPSVNSTGDISGDHGVTSTTFNTTPTTTGITRTNTNILDQQHRSNNKPPSSTPSLPSVTRVGATSTSVARRSSIVTILNRTSSGIPSSLSHPYPPTHPNPPSSTTASTNSTPHSTAPPSPSPRASPPAAVTGLVVPSSTPTNNATASSTATSSLRPPISSRPVFSPASALPLSLRPSRSSSNLSYLLSQFEPSQSKLGITSVPVERVPSLQFAMEVADAVHQSPSLPTDTDDSVAGTVDPAHHLPPTRTMSSTSTSSSSSSSSSSSTTTPSESLPLSLVHDLSNEPTDHPCFTADTMGDNTKLKRQSSENIPHTPPTDKPSKSRSLASSPVHPLKHRLHSNALPTRADSTDPSLSLEPHTKFPSMDDHADDDAHDTNSGDHDMIENDGDTTHHDHDDIRSKSSSTDDGSDTIPLSTPQSAYPSPSRPPVHHVSFMVTAIDNVKPKPSSIRFAIPDQFVSETTTQGHQATQRQGTHTQGTRSSRSVSTDVAIHRSPLSTSTQQNLTQTPTNHNGNGNRPSPTHSTHLGHPEGKPTRTVSEDGMGRVVIFPRSSSETIAGVVINDMDNDPHHRDKFNERCIQNDSHDEEGHNILRSTNPIDPNHPRNNPTLTDNHREEDTPQSLPPEPLAPYASAPLCPSPSPSSSTEASSRHSTTSSAAFETHKETDPNPSTHPSALPAPSTLTEVNSLLLRQAKLPVLFDFAPPHSNTNMALILHPSPTESLSSSTPASTSTSTSISSSSPFSPTDPQLLLLPNPSPTPGSQISETTPSSSSTTNSASSSPLAPSSTISHSHVLLTPPPLTRPPRAPRATPPHPSLHIISPNATIPPPSHFPISSRDQSTPTASQSKPDSIAHTGYAAMASAPIFPLSAASTPSSLPPSPYPLLRGSGTPHQHRETTPISTDLANHAITRLNEAFHGASSQSTSVSVSPLPSSAPSPLSSSASSTSTSTSGSSSIHIEDVSASTRRSPSLIKETPSTLPSSSSSMVLSSTPTLPSFQFNIHSQHQHHHHLHIQVPQPDTSPKLYPSILNTSALQHLAPSLTLSLSRAPSSSFPLTSPSTLYSSSSAVIGLSRSRSSLGMSNASNTFSLANLTEAEITMSLMRVASAIALGGWKTGSLQAFVDAHGTVEDMSETLFPISEVHKVAILDIRLLNLDRNTGNLLFRRPSRREARALERARRRKEHEQRVAARNSTNPSSMNSMTSEGLGGDSLGQLSGMITPASLSPPSTMTCLSSPPLSALPEYALGPKGGSLAHNNNSNSNMGINSGYCPHPSKHERIHGHGHGGMHHFSLASPALSAMTSSISPSLSAYTSPFISPTPSGPTGPTGLTPFFGPTHTFERRPSSLVLPSSARSRPSKDLSLGEPLLSYEPLPSHTKDAFTSPPLSGSSSMARSSRSPSAFVRRASAAAVITQHSPLGYDGHGTQNVRSIETSGAYSTPLGPITAQLSPPSAGYPSLLPSTQLLNDPLLSSSSSPEIASCGPPSSSPPSSSHKYRQHKTLPLLSSSHPLPDPSSNKRSGALQKMGTMSTPSTTATSTTTSTTSTPSSSSVPIPLSGLVLSSHSNALGFTREDSSHTDDSAIDSPVDSDSLPHTHPTHTKNINMNNQTPMKPIFSDRTSPHLFNPIPARNFLDTLRSPTHPLSPTSLAGTSSPSLSPSSASCSSSSSSSSTSDTMTMPGGFERTTDTPDSSHPLLQAFEFGHHQSTPQHSSNPGDRPSKLHHSPLDSTKSASCENRGGRTNDEATHNDSIQPVGDKGGTRPDYDSDTHRGTDGDDDGVMSIDTSRDGDVRGGDTVSVAWSRLRQDSGEDNSTLSTLKERQLERSITTSTTYSQRDREGTRESAGSLDSSDPRYSTPLSWTHGTRSRAVTSGNIRTPTSQGVTTVTLSSSTSTSTSSMLSTSVSTRPHQHLGQGRYVRQSQSSDTESDVSFVSTVAESVVRLQRHGSAAEISPESSNDHLNHTSKRQSIDSRTSLSPPSTSALPTLSSTSSLSPETDGSASSSIHRNGPRRALLNLLPPPLLQSVSAGSTTSTSGQAVSRGNSRILPHHRAASTILPSTSSQDESHTLSTESSQSQSTFGSPQEFIDSLTSDTAEQSQLDEGDLGQAEGEMKVRQEGHRGDNEGEDDGLFAITPLTMPSVAIVPRNMTQMVPKGNPSQPHQNTVTSTTTPNPSLPCHTSSIHLDNAHRFKRRVSCLSTPYTLTDALNIIADTMTKTKHATALATLKKRIRAVEGLRLIPIDHSYCLPSALNIGPQDLCWLSWAQTKIPCDENTVAYIKGINVEDDATKLIGLGIRQECVTLMRSAGIMLQKAIDRGLSLYDVGNMLCTRVVITKKRRDQKKKRSNKTDNDNKKYRVASLASSMYGDISSGDEDDEEEEEEEEDGEKGKGLLAYQDGTEQELPCPMIETIEQAKWITQTLLPILRLQTSTRKPVLLGGNNEPFRILPRAEAVIELLSSSSTPSSDSNTSLPLSTSSSAPRSYTPKGLRRSFSSPALLSTPTYSTSTSPFFQAADDTIKPTAAAFDLDTQQTHSVNPALSVTHAQHMNNTKAHSNLNLNAVLSALQTGASSSIRLGAPSPSPTLSLRPSLRTVSVTPTFANAPLLPNTNGGLSQLPFTQTKLTPSPIPTPSPDHRPDLNTSVVPYQSSSSSSSSSVLTTFSIAKLTRSFSSIDPTAFLSRHVDNQPPCSNSQPSQSHLPPTHPPSHPLPTVAKPVSDQTNPNPMNNTPHGHQLHGRFASRLASVHVDESLPTFSDSPTQPTAYILPVLKEDMTLDSVGVNPSTTVETRFTSIHHDQSSSTSPPHQISPSSQSNSTKVEDLRRRISAKPLYASLDEFTFTDLAMTSTDQDELFNLTYRKLLDGCIDFKIRRICLGKDE